MSIEPTLRAVALIRMSTARQLSSPERQRQLFADYCTRYELRPAGEYEDLATSATHTTIEQRPGIMAMWADATRDQFDIVWVEEISRAAREMTDILLLERYLRGRGIAFVSGDENPRTQMDPSFRKLFLAVEGFRAESETARLGERVFRDQDVRLRAGMYVGQRLPPGIRWEWADPADHARGGRYALDEARAPLAVRTFQLFVETRGNLNAAARTLRQEGYIGGRGGLIGYTGAQIIVKHPMYRGRIAHAGRTYEADVPEVVPRELVDAADALLTSRQGRPQRSTHAKALFSGMLRCPGCGGWLRVNHRPHRRPNYACARAYEGLCASRGVRSEGVIEAALLPRMAAELREIADGLRAQQRRASPSRATTAGIVKRLEQSEGRAMRLYVDGLITREKLDEEIGRIQAVRESLQAGAGPAPPRVTTRELRRVAKHLEQHWCTWSVASKRELLEAMVKHVVVDFEDLERSEIVWRVGE